MIISAKTLVNIVKEYNPVIWFSTYIKPALSAQHTIRWKKREMPPCGVSLYWLETVIVMHISITIGCEESWHLALGPWIWLNVTSCAPSGSLSSVTQKRIAISAIYKDLTQRKL